MMAASREASALILISSSAVLWMTCAPRILVGRHGRPDNVVATPVRWGGGGTVAASTRKASTAEER